MLVRKEVVSGRLRTHLPASPLLPCPRVPLSYLVSGLVRLLHPGSPLVVEAETEVRAVRVLLEPAQELLELAPHGPRARLSTPRFARPAARARTLCWGRSGSVRARPTEGARGQRRAGSCAVDRVPLGHLPPFPRVRVLPTAQPSCAPEEVGGRGRKGLLLHISSRNLIPVPEPGVSGRGWGRR